MQNLPQITNFYKNFNFKFFSTIWGCKNHVMFQITLRILIILLVFCLLLVLAVIMFIQHWARNRDIDAEVERIQFDEERQAMLSAVLSRNRAPEVFGKPNFGQNESKLC